MHNQLKRLVVDGETVGYVLGNTTYYKDGGAIRMSSHKMALLAPRYRDAEVVDLPLAELQQLLFGPREVPNA